LWTQRFPRPGQAESLPFPLSGIIGIENKTLGVITRANLREFSLALHKSGLASKTINNSAYTASFTADSLVLQPYSAVFMMPFLCPSIFTLQIKFGLSKRYEKSYAVFYYTEKRRRPYPNSRK
jgi:hypothetical protein